MDGIWIKRCPGCGRYIEKRDPQDICVCSSCGWDESVPAFYCSLVDKYCMLMTKRDADRILSEAGIHRP